MIRSLFLFLLASATAAAQSTLVLTPPPGTAAKAQHVVLLTGDEEYRNEEALPMLAKILSQRHGFKCTVLFPLDPDGTINPNNNKSLAGSEALENADVIVMALRWRKWTDEAMRRFEAAVNRGVPIIAIRTSTHPFNFPPDSPWTRYSSNSKAPWPGGWGKRVVGETWLTHWGKHKFEATRGAVEPANASDPLLNGVTDVFGTTDVYEVYPPADAKILLRGLVLTGMNPTDPPAGHRKPRVTDKVEQPVNNPAMPIAWTRVLTSESGRPQRVLTTTMGSGTDFENESLRRLIINGVYWAAGLEVPKQADVRYLDPYQPRMYGFDGFRTGLTPADHALGKTLPVGGTLPPKPPAPPKQAQATVPAATGKPAAASQAVASVQAEPLRENTPPFTLNPGDHLAFVGNTLADRMQHHSWLEAMVHAKFPRHQLVVRNLAVAGDEVVTRARSMDFGTPDEWLTHAKADVIFAFFGFNESFQGPTGLAKFETDLAKWLRDTQGQNYSGRGAPRIVLFSPIATEKHPDPNYSIPATVNENLALYAAAMARVAAATPGVRFVDLFKPSQELYAAVPAGQPLTINGLHLNSAGEAKLSARIFRALFGENAPAVDGSKLLETVKDKNATWHARYRTVDGYNVYGGRSKIAYESVKGQPKITNFQVMQEEMVQRDVMTANRDRRVWAAAQGNDVAAVEDTLLPPVTPFGTNKPGPKPDGTYDFLGGEEAIAKMTTSPGVKVNLFASEEQFPELAKAVQMNWDTRGRLWVAVWPSYPERTPDSKTGDSIIILEDTDHDGKADKLTHFLDDLNCPTGFQFFKDGILLVQAPDVWFVRDTNGDGKGDWKERVLMGLDSADSHHTANSLAIEPGGGVLFSDGVFHRTQIETARGPVRNIDGALYRFEPLTGRFETYVSYGFANPHGRAFDYWGNDIITDATGNMTYFGPAFSGHIEYPAKHAKMKPIWDRPSRPSAGSTIITTRHFPDEFWGNYLNPNVIGFQGIYRLKLVPDGAGLKGERQPDLLSSTDRNFRPIDVSVGPDGAIYVIDWHNPLIGHLQSHLRDSNRDHTRGRIYRLTYEGRPLAPQPAIDGQPIGALLELLKRGENQIRQLAKIELGKHDSDRVIAAVTQWTAALDAQDPDYWHHVTEALWMHQWHNRVNLTLLERVLRSPNADARAAAVRVLCYWRDRVPNALALLQPMATDESSRVRLQAVRAASFFSHVDAANLTLAATKLPIDYYLDYTIGETLKQLRPFWRKSMDAGEAIAGGDEAAMRYLLRTLSVAELLKMPRTPEVLANILARRNVPDAARAEALAGLMKVRSAKPVALLLPTLTSPAEVDVRGVGRLLLAQAPDELKAERAALLARAKEYTAEYAPYAWAAVAVGDGSLEAVWNESASSPLSRRDLLAGISLIPTAALRSTAWERVMPILETKVRDIAPPDVAGPDSTARAILRGAIRSAVSAKRDPEATLAALSRVIAREEEVPTAAQGIRALPRTSWKGEPAKLAADSLLKWAAKTHPSERTDRDYVETIQILDDLAGVLPAAESDPIRAALPNLRVSVFVVRAVVEEMRYDTPRLVVPTGKRFDIIFENGDVMPHNLVVVRPGTREAVGTAAMAMAPDQRDRRDRAFVPESPDVVAATRTLESGQNETLRIPAITTPGVYEYVCTFPGHWVMMYGQLVVTDDVEGYLKANPAPALSAAPAHPGH